MLDFCLVGFQKCGTTYLHHLLKQNPYVYLGSGKEKMFFVWHKWFEDPMQKMKHAFYSEDAMGRKIGSVEPTYYKNANEFYQYFGKQCKLIFMVRDRADRLFSFYRMAHRNGYKEVEMIYQNMKEAKDRTTANMFAAYVEGMMDSSIPDRHGALLQGNYQRWINEYESLYGSRQILVIHFEEFVKDTLNCMKRVEEFLGVPHWEYCLDVEANEGKSVPRNEMCFRILKRMAGVRNNFHYIAEDTVGSKLYNRFYLKIRKVFLKKDADSKMLEETRQKIADYYQKSKMQQ